MYRVLVGEYETEEQAEARRAIADSEARGSSAAHRDASTAAVPLRTFACSIHYLETMQLRCWRTTCPYWALAQGAGSSSNRSRR